MRCHMCGKPAQETCDECGQPVCGEHQCGTDMGMYWGVCEACFQRLEKRRWQNYMRLQETHHIRSEPSPVPKTPVQPHPQPPVKQKRLTPLPVDAPNITRGYLLTWLGALLFTGLMAGLTVWSAQAGLWIGVLLFGGLGLKMLQAMLISDTFRWLRYQLFAGQVPSNEQTAAGKDRIDTRLHHLLGCNQADVIAYLGEPENIQDLSLRGGVLADIEMCNLEYFSMGLRFFIRQIQPDNQPRVESIHYLSHQYETYHTYPGEIVPGLRVGMTQADIETVLGKPDAVDSLATPDERKWKRYTGGSFPVPIQAIEVWYPEDKHTSLTSVIVAIASQRNLD